MFQLVKTRRKDLRTPGPPERCGPPSCGAVYRPKSREESESRLSPPDAVRRGGDGAQATLYEKTTGVFMEVFTDRPGIQVYASGMLPEQKGKHGARHGLGAGLALETQVPPNAPNRKECDALRDLYTVEPKRPWKSTTIYRFSVK